MSEEIAENLDSDFDINYAQLIFLLKQGQWQDADYETYLLINRILNCIENCSCKKTQKFRGTKHNLQLINFPCKELKIIDLLWTTHSQGHFGFSIQKQIWFELLDKMSDPARNLHQWERHGIDNLSPQSEVERCRNFKPQKEDEIFAEMVGWYENKSHWPCNNWKHYEDLTPFDLAKPKGHLPVFWAYKFSRLYQCSTVANGGMMISFGVGLGKSSWLRTGTNINFFDIINSCNLEKFPQ